MSINIATREEKKRKQQTKLMGPRGYSSARDL